jgi:hypothetical protein
MAEVDIISIIKQQILESPEFAEAVVKIAKEQYKEIKPLFTRAKLAQLYDVHPDTIGNLSTDELERLGWEKIYVGSLPRFQRITSVIPQTKDLLETKRQRRNENKYQL